MVQSVRPVLVRATGYRPTWADPGFCNLGGGGYMYIRILERKGITHRE